jgi:excisionase family DNA binding protein
MNEKSYDPNAITYFPKQPPLLLPSPPRMLLLPPPSTKTLLWWHLRRLFPQRIFHLPNRRKRSVTYQMIFIPLSDRSTPLQNLWYRLWRTTRGAPPYFRSESYFTVSQAAKLLYYSPSTVRRYIRSGKLRAYKKDRRYYILPADIWRVKWDEKRCHL